MSRKQSVTFLDHTTSAAVMQLEAQLREFYAGVAPDHMDYVSVVAAAYHDDVDALNEALTEKYGRSLPATPVAPYGPSAAGDDGRRVNGEIETQPAAVSHNMNGHTASGSASPQSASARMRHLSVLPNPELWAPPNGYVGLAQAETAPDFVLVKRESNSRRPLLFSVALTVSDVTPHYITAVSGRAAYEITPGDYLIAIDKHVVAEADLDVIKHLLTSSVKDSCVVLTLFSKGRKQRYDCQLLRDTWTSELFNWQYVVKDEYAGQPLLANAAIVNVLEDMRLRLLQSSGGRKDLLSLDDEDIGGTSLGFRIEWDPNASAIMSLIISHVTGGGCAHQLQVGDAIVAVDGWRVLECSKDEVISLLRGDAIVGSTCNLVVNRRGELLQVQVCRTRSAQVRDANTLQQLCAELQQTASNASSAEHVVQQLMEHSITMEKRRCQRERLMANALRELQAFLTDGIDLALCNLKPPKSEPPKIEQHPRVLDVGDVDVYAWQRLKKLVESQSRFTLHELVCAMDESALGIETLMHLLLHLERGKGVDWSNIVEMFQLFNTSKGYSSAKQAIQVLKQHKSQPRQHHDYDPEILAAKLDSRVLHDGFSGRNTQKELENKLKEVEASLKMSQEITRRLEQELAKVKDFFRQLIEDQSSQILLLQQQLAHSVPTHLYEKMEQALAALAAENDQLKERRADTSELHLLQQQLASAEQGCNDATMHTQHYKQEMIELQSQLSNARMSTAVLEHNIKDLESKLQDMGATLRDTAGKLKDVEATFNDSQANHREIEAKLLAMQKDADELLVNLEHLLHNLPQEAGALGKKGEEGQALVEAPLSPQVLLNQQENLDRLHQELASAREHEAMMQQEMYQLEQASSKAAQDLRTTTGDLIAATQELVRVDGRMQELERMNRKLQCEACTNPAIHDEIHELQDRFDELVTSHGKQGIENRALKKRVEELEKHQQEPDDI